MRITAVNGDGSVMGTAYSNNAKTAYLGWYGGQDDHAFFTFSPVNLPRGARVVGAWLRVQAADSGSPGCLLRVSGFAQDHAAPVSGYSDWQSRPRTVAEVSWAPEEWSRNAWFSSPDLTAIVQEIVDRDGWSPGRGLGLTLGPASGNAGQRSLFQRDQGAANAAELIVDYVP